MEDRAWLLTAAHAASSLYGLRGWTKWKAMEDKAWLLTAAHAALGTYGLRGWKKRWLKLGYLCCL